MENKYLDQEELAHFLVRSPFQIEWRSIRDDRRSKEQEADMDRREFMVLASLPLVRNWLPVSEDEPDAFRRLCGRNLQGWTTIVGDGVYACPGEPPVGPADIAAIHGPDFTELQANVFGRAIMAHNLTYLRRPETVIAPFLHVAGYSFRLLFVPSPAHPAQTLEGHLALWDGQQTRLDYIAGFQWILNFWQADYGALYAWAPPGEWHAVGHLEPDTAWHTVSMTVDRQRMRSDIALDGTTYYADELTAMQRPDWGTDVTARLAAEIISVYPGSGCQGALHRALFRDWCWERRRMLAPALQHA